MGSHFNSKGDVYSFGNNSSFKKTNNSKVNLYANKIEWREMNKKLINNLSKEIESKLNKEMCHGIQVLSTLLPTFNL